MKLYLNVLFYLSTVLIPLLDGQPTNIQKISDWMFLLREENSNLYRLKDEAKFNYNEELPTAYQAIFLNVNNEFIMPRIKNKEQIVEFNENVIPVCRSSMKSASGNYFYSYHSIYEELNRNQNYEIVLHSIPRTATELSVFSTERINNQCKIPSKPMVKHKSDLKLENTPDTCILYEVGYWVTNLKTELDIERKEKGKQPKIDSWKTLYEACYNHQFNATYYTYHRIYYEGLLARKLNQDLNQMSKVKTMIPDIYDPEYQQSNYKYHNNPLNRGKFNIHSNFIVPSRLVPSYDMLFESWQYATNEYLNFAPQWRSVNLNNWLEVEAHVRLMALRMKSNLHVYTGVVYEKLDSPFIEILKTIKKNSTVRIPVYHWKYIVNEDYEFGIVLVTVNNRSDKPCKDICREYGWPYDDRNSKISKGRTRCCDPSKFFEIIPYEVGEMNLPKKIMHFSGTQQEQSNPGEVFVYRNIWMSSEYFNS